MRSLVTGSCVPAYVEHPDGHVRVQQLARRNLLRVPNHGAARPLEDGVAPGERGRWGQRQDLRPGVPELVGGPVESIGHRATGALETVAHLAGPGLERRMGSTQGRSGAQPVETVLLALEVRAHGASRPVP